MPRLIASVSLMLMLLILSSFAFADDQTGSSDKKESRPKPAQKPAKEKVRTDFLRGKILKIETTERYLTLQVTTKIPQENASAAMNAANLRRQLIGNRDPNSIRSIQLELMKNEQNLVTYKDEVKKVEIALGDDPKVRTMLLPVEYDDKGKPRRLTEKEKKALKGSDLKAPGYEAEMDSLQPNQLVEVYIIKPKTTARSKNKDAPDEKERQKARMIVIISESPK
jgi:hypothetical protein